MLLCTYTTGTLEEGTDAKAGFICRKSANDSEAGWSYVLLVKYDWLSRLSGVSGVFYRRTRLLTAPAGLFIWKCTFSAVLPNRIQEQNFYPPETRAGGPRFVTAVTAGTAIIIWPSRETHQESLIYMRLRYCCGD
jgi:hypothetical protein